MTDTTSERCPKCDAAAVVPLVYGKPGPELIARAERGEVRLGIGVMFDGCPNRACKSCRHTWLETSDPGYIEGKRLREKLRAYREQRANGQKNSHN